MRVSNGSFPQVRTRLENTHPGIHFDTYITLMPRKMVVDSEDRFLQKPEEFHYHHSFYFAFAVGDCGRPSKSMT